MRRLPVVPWGCLECVSCPEWACASSRLGLRGGWSVRVCPASEAVRAPLMVPAGVRRLAAWVGSAWRGRFVLPVLHVRELLVSEKEEGDSPRAWRERPLVRADACYLWTRRWLSNTAMACATVICSALLRGAAWGDCPRRCRWVEPSVIWGVAGPAATAVSRTGAFRAGGPGGACILGCRPYWIYWFCIYCNCIAVVCMGSAYGFACHQAA